MNGHYSIREQVRLNGWVTTLTPRVVAAWYAAMYVLIPCAVLAGLTEVDPFRWPWLIAPALAAAAAALRGWRIYVRLDESGLTIRNIWRTHRVPWSNVNQAGAALFWWSPIALFSALSPADIRTNDGRRLIVQATLNWGGDERFFADLRARGVPLDVRLDDDS